MCMTPVHVGAILHEHPCVHAHADCSDLVSKVKWDKQGPLTRSMKEKSRAGSKFSKSASSDASAGYSATALHGSLASSMRATTASHGVSFSPDGRTFLRYGFMPEVQLLSAEDAEALAWLDVPRQGKGRASISAVLHAVFCDTTQGCRILVASDGEGGHRSCSAHAHLRAQVKSRAQVESRVQAGLRGAAELRAPVDLRAQVIGR